VDVPVPAAHPGFVYVFSGSGAVGGNGTRVEEGGLALLPELQHDEAEAAAAATTFRIANPAGAAAPLRALLGSSPKIDDPIARYGPFVMNTAEELEQAFDDYRGGRLGRIDGEAERRALAEAARRAQQASGTWGRQQKEL
jgi:redox-sensitive bicupin YhaK (pirin superfamily)